MRSWSFILKPLANGDFSLSFPFVLSLLDCLELEFFWTFFYFSINPDCAIGSVPYLLVVVIMVVIAGKMIFLPLSFQATERNCEPRIV